MFETKYPNLFIFLKNLKPFRSRAIKEKQNNYHDSVVFSFLDEYDFNIKENIFNFIIDDILNCMVDNIKEFEQSYNIQSLGIDIKNYFGGTETDAKRIIEKRFKEGLEFHSLIVCPICCFIYWSDEKNICRDPNIYDIADECYTTVINNVINQ